jgi:hypothetical protein
MLSKFFSLSKYILVCMYKSCKKIRVFVNDVVEGEGEGDVDVDGEGDVDVDVDVECDVGVGVNVGVNVGIDVDELAAIGVNVFAFLRVGNVLPIYYKHA